MNGKRLEPDLQVFEDLLGREFSAQPGDQLIRFKLTEVSKLPQTTTRAQPGRGKDSFALLFKEVTNIEPGQGNFTISTDCGTIDLFLAQVGIGEYEAIFN